MMTTSRLGEVIELEWPCEPDAIFVRGWVPAEEALAALVLVYGDMDLTAADLKYCWGRWAQTAASRAEGWNAELRVYDEPGPGRFKIMQADA